MNTQLVDQIRSILEKNSNGVGFALIQVKAGSAENARECLAEIKAVQHNGYWFLPENAPVTPANPVDKRTNKEKARDLLLAAGAKGITRKHLSEAGFPESTHYQILCDVRKNYFDVVRTPAVHDSGPLESVWIAIQFFKEETPPAPQSPTESATRLTMREKGKIESAHHRVSQSQLSPELQELCSKVAINVQTAVVKTRTLRLNRGDVGDLLCVLFGFPAIEWHDDSEHMAILVDTTEGGAV